MSGPGFNFIRLILILIAVSVCSASTPADVEELAAKAASEDRKESAAAISALRQLGYAGLDAVIDKHRALIAEHLDGAQADARWERVALAIDSVARQKDAWASGLYWHTDIDSALAEASRTGKPVISLRLLGNLDEDLSCANSRFFRTLLYSDPRISETMRSKFVLHWSSERQAPRMTVDFGDGRRLVTTVTGNSVHYFISADGMVVDALPGLYSPEKFLDYLRSISSLAGSTDDQAGAAAAYRKQTRTALTDRRGSDRPGSEDYSRPVKTEPPAALEAAPRAVTKMVAEIDLLQPTQEERERLLQVTRGRWSDLAAGYPVTFSAETLRLIRVKAFPPEAFSEERFGAMKQKLERSVALDTARNEFLFHATILEWLEADPQLRFADLNSRLYSDLFLTPDNDPWLGLFASDSFTGVEGNGIRE